MAEIASDELLHQLKRRPVLHLSVANPLEAFKVWSSEFAIQSLEFSGIHADTTDFCLTFTY